MRLLGLMLLVFAACPWMASAHAEGSPASTPAWSQAKVRLERAQRLAAKGRPVIVAVVDSGVDGSDPALQAALVPGYDFTAGAGGERADPLGHGTAVAGVIAGRTKVYGAPGACARCLIMPIRVVGPSGFAQPAAIAAGIRWAAAAGARVINVSLLVPRADPDVTAAVVDAIAGGAIVVAGAGNDGVSTRGWPAADPGVISVAATDRSDARETWSNFGQWVDVAAPGCTVTQGTNARFVRFCGTSSATALVSGIIALALSARPQTTSADVASALASTSVHVGGFVRWGRIDAAALLGALLPGSTRPR